MKKESDQLVRIGGVRDGGHFEKSLRDELIRAIEDGVPRGVIAYQYGVSRSAISGWMREHSSKEYRSRQGGDHLTAVEKRSIVRQMERGELTPHAARKEYGINGSTLNKWLKASRRENAELAVYDPFEMKDKPQLPDAEKEALKKALEEAQMKINALNTLIDVAEDQFKIAIRKKAGARQSKS
jgi:transposase-like protein